VFPALLTIGFSLVLVFSAMPSILQDLPSASSPPTRSL